ncbi:MAG: ATP-dependent DNA helicase RecG [Bdellovibrionales bacterium RIFCSPHIGHO2_01_FULL_40_29]|nr:MAG: ATP-dependent DNA helicase RecG [Bdellovibrionales bacterium RIFCSPHIGHO2_01_FULL_40_29]OFZ32637.1 MAG: ATP-dependent DNA helicase RecG [Bdellovibrionales bacterium RIFCSPHIGHO2_02_FULL_40_15]
MALRLDTDIQYLKGVGPKLGSLFSRNGIKTIQDLIQNYPRAYEDRRAARNIASLRPDDVVSLKATVVSVASFNMGKSSRKIYDVIVRDSSGQIRCKYFRVPYRGYFDRFKPGAEVRIVGKVTNYRNKIEFHHPDIKDIEPDEDFSDALIPIYVEIEGLSSAKMNQLVMTALAQISEWPLEKLSDPIVKELGLIPYRDAITKIHHPEPDLGNLYNEFKSEAHRRLIFEEFFWLEIYLASKRSGLKSEKGFSFSNPELLIQKMKLQLPFALTGAQLKSFQEIKIDLESGKPMNRLVQGDVGSGKTIVSFMAALKAIESGFQVCLMAPTEILAEQHFRNTQNILLPLGIKCDLLTGKTKAKERKEILERLISGETHFLMGTHALIEDWVQFKSLGLVIIDEQHRFGVAQRGLLKNKGVSPHFLIMTATPIPRTLAMTVYGDLDVSIIDEMPVGRTPIQTRVITESKRRQAIDFMVEHLTKGRQAYVVYPLVEESEKIDLKNATDEFEKLKSEFPKVRFGLLHGKMKSQEKDDIMMQFRNHDIDALISTTVIEVGVDVPNATVMIIEHAERFGLSQLHQLRGRVGRGMHKSFCVMIMGYAVSQETRERVEFMEKTNDGFKVAEFDLQIRGPGEFMGARQSGLTGFKMANLVRDFDLLKVARDQAFRILAADPKLLKKEHALLREELLKSYGPAALAGIG